MYKTTVIFGALIVAGIISISAFVAQSSTAQSDSSMASSLAGAFASVKTEITDTQIVITIDRNPNAPPVEPGTNATIPEGPIIIIPPNNETGQNGTIIVPEPPANVTLPGGNVTLPIEPPVIVVDPDGNSTAVTPPSNVTVIDNGTVVVAPPDQPVTEVPGNVTVISPPPVNATEPEPCGCPPATGVEGGAPDIQFPGSNITIQNDTTIVRPDTEPGSESGNGGDGNGDNNGG